MVNFGVLKLKTRIFFMKKTILLWCLTFLLTGVADAQAIQDFTFSHLGADEGLLNQRIYTIWQTADHALWWSSKEGIDRYNGAYVKHYRLESQQSFSSNAGLITKLTIDNDSSLIGFDNKGGIYDYDEQLDRFRLRTDLSALFGHDVILNDVLVTADGLWLGMREGVYVLQSDKKLTPIVKDVYPNTFIKKQQRLLLCTRDGVFDCDIHPKAGGKPRKLLPYQIESGYYDERHDRVWLGGFLGGLHIMKPTADGRLTACELAGDAIYNPIRSICPYDESTMLVGIDGLGVYKVSRQPSAAGKYEAALLFDASSGPHGVLHGNGVYALKCDSWGNIVIGTYSGGIDIARPVGSTPAVFQHGHNNQQSLLNDHVNCVAQWADGTMVMGTDNGVSFYHPDTQQWQHTCHGAVVLSLALTPTGTMLVGTYGKGVYEISRNGQARQLYTENDNVLKDSHVYKVFYDRDGGLWMGCLDGDLVHHTTGGTRYYPIKNVQDIAQLPDGQIAVATANGIHLVNAKTGKVSELNYAADNPDDVNKYVMTLHVNDGKTLWIGTDGGGVYIYDLTRKTCRQLTTDNGLPSNVVSSIDNDNRGRLLLATERGLSFVSPDDTERVIDVNYCYGLGREYAPRAVVNLQNGFVLYGTTTGALVVNPDNIQAINYTAKIHLLDVSCSDDDSEMFHQRVHRMLPERKLYLHYKQRTFDLSFECINLRNQFDIVYQYQVSGGEWSHPSNQQIIRFTNLEPGSHKLLLRSVSRTSKTVIDEVELTINIAHPWWNSWWMRLFYIGLVILLFYGAWKVYQLHTKYMRLVMATVTTNNQADEFIEAEEDASAPDSQQEENTEGNDFIDRATKIVIEHISDSEFSIDRLCREMAMSRTLFYVKLKSYTGKSPQDFIRIIRLERAAALLRNGRSVTDAAALAGFDNPKYFSTVFKKYFGVSPSKFE